MTDQSRCSSRWSLRPSGFGWAYAGLCLVVFLLAVNYGNNLVYGLCFLLIGLGLNALLLGYGNVKDIQVRFLRTEPAFAGESARFVFTASEPDGRDRWGLVLGSVAADSRSVFSLQSDGVSSVALDVATGARGRLVLSDLQLASRYPLGLARFRRLLSVDSALPTCLVYPAPKGAAPLPSPERASGREASVDASDPAGARAYRAGDSLSQIDWKASARSTEILTKEFDGGDRLPALWLDLATTPGEDLEAQLSLLCAWVLESQRHGLVFGLRLPGWEAEPAADRGHVMRCLRALALYGLSDAGGEA